MTTEAPAAPANPAEAETRLGILGADPDWVGKFLGNDAAAAKEFQELTTLAATGSPVDAVMAGLEPQDGVAAPGVREMTLAAEILRSAGVSEGAVRQALENRPVSAAEVAAVKNLQASRHADKAWVTNLLNGHPDAVREHTLMAIVLSSPISEGAAK